MIKHNLVDRSKLRYILVIGRKGYGKRGYTKVSNNNRK